MFYLLNGESGLITYVQKKNELSDLEQKLAITQSKRNKLQNKVERMYPSSLDQDLLDEQYRRTTGELSKNEAIYFYE